MIFLQNITAKFIFIAGILIIGGFLLLLAHTIIKRPPGNFGAGLFFAWSMIAAIVTVIPLTSSMIFFYNRTVGSSILEVVSLILIVILFIGRFFYFGLSSEMGSILRYPLYFSVYTFIIYQGPIKRLFITG